MNIEVRVELKHIRGSEPDSTTMCAIARALREQYPDRGLWCVWMDRVALWPGRGYGLPSKATQFISNLIEGKPVTPFTFVLEE